MRNRGTYLLEFSLVIFGVVFAVIAILDISSILRARTAARVAVETGLRCMFPTDTECPARSNGNIIDDGSRFDVFVTPRLEDTVYGVPMYRLRAEANWYTLARRAGVVTSGALDLPEEHYQIIRTGASTIGDAIFLMQDSELPTVSGAMLNPQFAVAPNRNGRGEYNRSLTAVGMGNSGCSGDFDPNCEIQSIQLPAINVVGGDPLILNETSQRICWKYGDPQQPCTLFDASTTNHLPSPGSLPGFDTTQALIHISGSVIDAEEGAEGAVTLKIEYEADSNSNDVRSIDLGGRLISPGSSGNFVTRGLGAQRAGSNGSEKYEEVEKYDGLAIPVGRPFKLRMFVKSKNGKRIGWKGDTIRIVTPTYSIVKEPIECAAGTGPNGVPDYQNACAFHPKAEAIVNVRPGSGGDIVSFIADLGCKNEVEANSEFNKFLLRNPSVPASLQSFNDGSCGPLKRNGNCPDGALFESTVCKNFSLYDVAAQVCPSLVTLPSISHKITEKSPAKAFSICQYQISSDTLECGSESFSRSAGSNDRVSPNSICPLADSHNYSPPPTTDSPERICNQTEAAEREGLLRSALAIVPQTITTEVIREVRQEAIYAEKPKDACLVVNTYATGERKLEMVCGRALSRAMAEECCRKHNGDCRFEAVQQPKQQIAIQKYEARIEKAVYAAESAFEAIWPGSAAHCTNSNVPCSTVEFSVNGASEVAGHSEISVPLTILRILPGNSSDSIVISAKASRSTEESVALAKSF